MKDCDKRAKNDGQTVAGRQSVLRPFLTYLRDCRVRLLWIAGISLCPFLCITALLLIMVPHESFYSMTTDLVLEKQGDTFLYPNNRPFNSVDLLNPIVLKSVYDALNLKEKTSFERFSSSLSVAQSDERVAEIVSDFSEKLKKKKLNAVEIKRLEDLYQQEKTRIGNISLKLTMSADIDGITEKDAAAVLHSIPEHWYNIYSKMEARSFPDTEIAESARIFSISNDMFRNISLLIPWERANAFCNKLLSICNSLNSMLLGQNICLPSGDTLGDIIKRIKSLQKYDIGVCRQYVLLHPKKQFVFDRILLECFLDNAETELTRLTLTGEGIEMALNAITDHAVSGSGMTVSDSESGSLQLDVDFFNSIAELIRNDINYKQRERYSLLILENKEKMASAEAQNAYFLKLLKNFDSAQQAAPGTVSISEQQLNEQLAIIHGKLMTETKKVIQIRDLILKHYLKSRKFYSNAQNISSETEYAIPRMRTNAGLFFLWLFLFCSFTVFDFMKKRNEGVSAPVQEKGM